MALPTSMPINLLQICAEFGAPAGTPLTAFYRGGPYVPNLPVNYGVPTEGHIGMHHLLGAANLTPILASANQSGGTLFTPEPAPNFANVSGSLIPVVSGGSGSYTYWWDILDTGAGLGAFSWSRIGNTVSATANLPKNNSRSPLFRLSVSDGYTSVYVDRYLTLTYSTDA
jgi:hypothetical protein